MNTDLFNLSMVIMAQGMIGVFLVIIIIYFVILALTKFFPESPESNEN